MTPAQRANRIRNLVAERQRLAISDREIAAELQPLENEESASLGFRFPPMRGERLVAEMDRRDLRAEGRVAA